VQALLQRLVDSGPEVGLQVAAYLDGQLVIDAWAGLADEASGQAVDGNTLFMLLTTTKGITATCMHRLAELGKIDYDEPIVTYWPEFGSSHKEHATVRHALCHQAGVPQTPKFYTPEWLSDWDRMCDGIARLKPMFEPGTRTIYHSLTFGHLCGEILRRADGRGIGQFLQDEIAGPLGMDTYLGVPDALLPRVATLKDGPPAPVEHDARMIGDAADSQVAKYYNRREVQQAAIPGAGGIMSARGLARHYAMLANWGELDGVRIVSRARVRTAMELQSFEYDEVYGLRVRRGLGYRLGVDAGPGATPECLGHVGKGGSFGYANPAKRFALAFAKNYVAYGPRAASSEDPGEAVARTVLEALDLT
jgi:CubicO group peptidase (beta-lactamase class C family)